MDASEDLLQLLQDHWPSQARIVSADLIRYLAEQTDPIAAADELAGRQGDIGQRMDLAASLTILASALTVIKLAFEIVKMRMDARQATTPAELKKEIEIRLSDKTVVIALGEERIDLVLAQILSRTS